MRKTITGVWCLMLSCTLFAQSNPEKYAATINKDELKKYLSVIAGPEMEGRETGTEGQRKAAAYIAGQFERIGLKAPNGTKNYQQEYPLYYDSIVKVDLNLDKRALAFGKDYSISTQTSTSKNVSANKVVFVGYGITEKQYNDYAGKNVKGKIVLMFAGEPKNDTIYTINGTTRPSTWSYPTQGEMAKAELAASKGAKAVLFVSPSIVTFREQSTLRKTKLYYPENALQRRVNVISLSHATAGELLGTDKFETLLAMVKAGTPLNNENIVIKKKVKIAFKKEKFLTPATNVAGYIEGTDKKDEYIILTAHYDHLGRQGERIFYGADDDGSGTAAVIKMAEAFAQAKAEGNGPRRTIVFMAVSGEEKGLLGSRYYSENPLFPLRNTSVNLNTDMIGRIDPARKYGDSTNYVYIIGDDKLSSDLAPITEQANKKFTRLELDRKYNDIKDLNRFYYRSDHYNFAKKGVPIIFYFNGTHADYHRETDTVDKINFRLMAKRAQLIFHTAWTMANRDQMLKRDMPMDQATFSR